MSEARVVQQMRQHVAESVMMARTAGHADTIYLPDVLEVIDTLTQRAEAAEAKLRDVAYWHEAWKEAEAERDALRKALEVVRPFVRVIREARKADVLGEIHGERVRVYVGCLLTPSLAHSDDVIAALAVRPTTGEAK